MSVTVGGRGFALTSRCPVRHCEVTGFEFKSGQMLTTPLGTYVEDNDQSHIPPYAVGEAAPFKGGAPHPIPFAGVAVLQRSSAPASLDGGRRGHCSV